MNTLVRTASNLEETSFPMEVKPVKKKHIKGPKFFRKLILKVVFDGSKTKKEKSPAKRVVSAPVPSKEVFDKELVRSAVAIFPKFTEDLNRTDSLPSAPPPSPMSLQVTSPSTPTSSPRSVTSTLSGSSASTLCEKPEDDPNHDDYSDLLPPEEEDDATKISRLTQQNGDLSCKLDTARSEIVQLKIKLNRISARASQSEESESITTVDLTVQTGSSSPKSVRFAEPLEEYEPDNDVSEVVEALCLAHAQISDLEAEKKAADEEMENLFIELHVVEKRVHEWEEGVTARLKALEEELDDQRSEIIYLHDKLREARGQSSLSTDKLGRSHSLSERDITTMANKDDSDTDSKDAAHDSDSEWEDISSIGSIKTAPCSKIPPEDWPSLLNERFPIPPPLTGCMEKAKNILKASRHGKPAPLIDNQYDPPASLEQSDVPSNPTDLTPGASSTHSSPSTTDTEVARERISEEQASGLSLQMPLAIEVRPFNSPDVSEPTSKVASQLDSIPQIQVHPPSPFMNPGTTALPRASADSVIDDSTEIVVGRKLSVTTARASVVVSS